ncbi:NAD dependent epimerase/dehydratase [Boeremia exigua]|uniref:NAD dependent epimerase/dehydratase n=1 Tax=Boeremia exigua TaxID=749465 RepID=UPI001E8D2008|nr:NAD dependent epimerase/dehydratase [Boeremia exigua]KAH6619057.1 NAD dependent epimerase/dehydratase [Boeremia exigua]
MCPHTVLLTGATGFIGGSVLTMLMTSIDHNIKNLLITTLVRHQDQADLLADRGIRAELFEGLDDTERLRHLASDYDIVFHCATGLHTPSAEALVLGLGDSMKRSGNQAYYIHTTGTSNLAYSSLSNPEASIRDFSDVDDDIYEEEVRLSSDQFYPQRQTDLVVLQAAEKTGVKAYLMMPPTVYGRGLGMFNKESIQLPFTVRHAIHSGYPEYLGDGSGTVGYVHIADLASLYEVLLSKILAGTDVPHGRKGYFFSNTGAFTWKEVNERLGEIGHRLGILRSPKPVPITLSKALEQWGFTEGNQLLLEINHAGRWVFMVHSVSYPKLICGWIFRSKTTPKNAYHLGWKPEKTAADWDAQLEETWRAVANRVGS